MLVECYGCITITATWFPPGIVSGAGKYVPQIFPIGVIGLYQSQPKRKNISVPPMRMPQ